VAFNFAHLSELGQCIAPDLLLRRMRVTKSATPLPTGSANWTKAQAMFDLDLAG